MVRPSISASVGAKGHNRKADVETVQRLLNHVPNARGGPAPLLSVDGLCYGKTQQAIGRFQQIGCNFRWPDQLIQPEQRTWNELIKFAPIIDAPIVGITIRCFPRGSDPAGNIRFFASTASSAAFFGSPPILGAPPAAPTAADLVAAANTALPLATSWVVKTLARLGKVKQSIARTKVYSSAELKQAEPFKAHFKINLATQIDTVVRSRLDRVEKTFTRIQQALGALPSRMIGNPAEPAKATAPLGGFDNKGAVVTIGADFLGPTVNSNLRAAVLVHECAHFVDKDCGHVASELPAPGGTAITDASGKLINPGGLTYSQMDFNLAIRNAYSFAQCAAHCGLGSDKRPL